MPRIEANDAVAWAMRGQALAGAPRINVSSRKYALTTTQTTIPLPVFNRPQQDNALPSFIRIAVGGGVVYANFNGAAVIPTTSADGSELIIDNQVISLHNQTQISLIAEAACTVTITYVWS